MSGQLNKNKYQKIINPIHSYLLLLLDGWMIGWIDRDGEWIDDIGMERDENVSMKG